jgi:hypothetical protein
MIKLVHHQPKWLALLILVIAAVLVIAGCPPSGQPPTEPTPTEQLPTEQLPTEQTPTGQPPTDEPPVNQPPVIDSLTSQWRQVKRSMPVPIACTAWDPDGDGLSYVWSVDGGDITGEGTVGNWFTPEDYGTYTITVAVSDGRGGQDTKSLEIKVACCLREADE